MDILKYNIIRFVKFCYGFINLGLLNLFKCFRIVSKLKYKNLYAIRHFSYNTFIKERKYIIDYISEHIKNSGKIKMAFLVYTSSMWTVDELYRLLKKEKFIDVDIIVAKFKMHNAGSENEMFNDTVNFFKNVMNYDVISINSYQKQLNKYDLLFYLTPYEFVEKEINVRNISMDKLLCYTNYSYMLAENVYKFNLPIYPLAWRFYCDTKFYENKMVECFGDEINNAIYCGYTKMDTIYSYLEKGKRTKNSRKVIIYAPHHSVSYSGVRSATFNDNHEFMLNMALKYSNSTYWIYKPHPLLRDRSVEAGIYSTLEEYDEYEKEWNSLENASVVKSGDYFDTFVNSDAMITDSISFLAEYQFVGKPILLLESGKQVYNAFGESVKNVLYKCAGTDLQAIELFVNDIISENDCMLELRKSFFKENLDYYSELGSLASDYIFSDICELLN